MQNEPERVTRSLEFGPTDNLRRPIVFTWGLASNFGWGVVGLNLALALAEDAELLPIFASPIDATGITLDSLRRRLEPVLSNSSNFGLQLGAYDNCTVSVSCPVLHALGNGLSAGRLRGDVELRGRSDIGLYVIEDTAIDDGARRRAIRHSLLVAASTWNKNLVEAQALGVPLELVPQGVDLSLFHPGPKTGRFKDRFVVFSGGKLEFRKGQDLVLLAFRAFRQRHPEALLVTAWHSPWAGLARQLAVNPRVAPVALKSGGIDVMAWAAANNLPADSVVDLGPVPNFQMPPILRECDVALFPNRAEGGTNLVAMECMACGIPSILSANTGHLDLIAGDSCLPLERQARVASTPFAAGTDGWGESDVEEIIEALETLWRRRDRMASIGHAGANMMTEWGWSDQVAKLKRVLLPYLQEYAASAEDAGKLVLTSDFRPNALQLKPAPSDGRSRQQVPHPRPATSPNLSEALQLHRQGRLAEAEIRYRQVLEAEPRHTEALHLLGVIALQQTRLEEADRLISEALVIRPDFADALINHGTVLRGLGRLDAALTSYEKALALRPLSAEALHNHGNVLRDLGRLGEALASYERSLAIRPDNVDALRNQAKILHGLGRLTEALASYDRALSARPDDPEALNNRALALWQLGRFDEALASCDKALAIRPNFPEALNNRGDAFYGLGCLEEALATYDRALELRPDDADLLNNRGNALYRLGRLQEALATYDRALAVKPDHAEVLNNRGSVLRDLQQLDALAGYDDTLSINPEDAEALRRRGNALMDLRHLEEALASYDRALAITPDDVEALNNHANALGQLGRTEEALASCEKALAVQPGHPVVLNNRGNFLRDLGRAEEAAASYAAAVAAKPDFAEALSNHGTALKELGRLDEALARYAAALALRPDFAPGHWHEAICRLMAGDFENGWAKYEWRWRLKASSPEIQQFGKPLWLGKEDLAGKTVFLYAEQGFGDTLQFCRYAPAVAARGATVILGVQAQLRPLLRTLPGIEHVTLGNRPPAPFDFHCPLLSLPLAFGTRLETVPAHVPYLSANPFQADAWRDRLAKFDGLKVGLVWAGSGKFGIPGRRQPVLERRRSMRLEQMSPLAAIGGVTLVSLQKDEPALQTRSPPAGMEIHDWTDELADFADTAALIAALDLVVSVDTAVAHLAGALGKPVWLLNCHDNCWRWLHDRDDSPWYPTMRLFRQPRPGDWASVVRRVSAELRALAGGRLAALSPEANRPVRPNMFKDTPNTVVEAIAA